MNGKMFSEAVNKTLGLVGADVNLANRKAMIRFISECIPGRKQLVQSRIYANHERERRKVSEKKTDLMRESIERILNDCPTKNEMIRELESLMIKSGYSDAQPFPGA